MERKPPLVTSISNLLGFAYAYLDLVSLCAVLGMMLVPSPYDTYFHYLFYVIVALWLFGLLAGRYSFDRVFGYRLIVIIGVIALIVTLMKPTDTSFVAGDVYSGVSTLLMATFLYLVVTSAGIQARCWLYILVSAFVLMLTTVASVIAGEVPISALSLLVLGCYWLGFARKELILRIGAVGLIAVIAFYILSLSPGLIPVPLMLALLAILMLQRNGLVVIPLSILVYAILNRGEAVSLWVANILVWVQTMVESFNVNQIKEIFIGGGFYQNIPLFRDVLTKYGILWILLVFVMLLRINIIAYGNYKKTLLPSVKYGSMLTIGMSILLLALLFDLESQILSLVWVIYVWFIALSVVKQEIP